MAETKPTRCAEAPALLKSRSFATGVPSFLVAFTQQVRARAPRDHRARGASSVSVALEPRSHRATCLDRARPSPPVLVTAPGFWPSIENATR